MLPRTYVIRVTDEVRRRYEDRIDRYEASGETEEAESWREALAQVEANDGQEHEELVCAVCGYRYLKPTHSGKARPHKAAAPRAASWDEMRELRTAIAAMQAELDRMLDQLEPD